MKKVLYVSSPERRERNRIAAKMSREKKKKYIEMLKKIAENKYPDHYLTLAEKTKQQKIIQEQEKRIKNLNDTIISLMSTIENLNTINKTLNDTILLINSCYV